MALVAITTIAVMTHPYGRAEIAGFEELVPSVFDAAREAPGFVARAKPVDDRDDLSNFERDWGRWGSFTTPRFYEGGRTMETDCRASTLSLWEDLESVFQFTYQGIHRYALQNKHQWFRRLDWRTYCAWWVDDDYLDVTWRDACERLEYLTDHGATRRAFTFRQPYDSAGRRTRLPPAPASRG